MSRDYAAEERVAALIVDLNAHRDITATIHLAREAGMTVTDIAHHAGLSRSAVHRALKADKQSSAASKSSPPPERNDPA
jgi:DNA-binding phage protein